MCEHFTLLPHREDPGVPREVVDDPHIISATTECSHLSWPHTFEWLTLLLSKLTGCTYAFNLLLSKGRESDDDSFRMHAFELLEIDVADAIVS